MKNSDKVTLSIAQLKKLVKEAYGGNDINDDLAGQIEILNDLKNAVEITIVEANQMTKGNERNSYAEDHYRKGLQRILKYAKVIEKFDAVAL